MYCTNNNPSCLFLTNQKSMKVSVTYSQGNHKKIPNVTASRGSGHRTFIAVLLQPEFWSRSFILFVLWYFFVIFFFGSPELRLYLVAYLHNNSFSWRGSERRFNPPSLHLVATPILPIERQFFFLYRCSLQPYTYLLTHSLFQPFKS